jgi:hypothetical protein
MTDDGCGHNFPLLRERLSEWGSSREKIRVVIKMGMRPWPPIPRQVRKSDRRTAHEPFYCRFKEKIYSRVSELGDFIAARTESDGGVMYWGRGEVILMGRD